MARAGTVIDVIVYFFTFMTAELVHGDTHFAAFA